MWQAASFAMQELPQSLPFLQDFIFPAGSELTAAAEFSAGALAAGTEEWVPACIWVKSPPSLRQTSFIEIQLFPQGLPFLQLRASAD